MWSWRSFNRIDGFLTSMKYPREQYEIIRHLLLRKENITNDECSKWLERWSQCVVLRIQLAMTGQWTNIVWMIVCRLIDIKLFYGCFFWILVEIYIMVFNTKLRTTTYFQANLFAAKLHACDTYSRPSCWPQFSEDYAPKWYVKSAKETLYRTSNNVQQFAIVFVGACRVSGRLFTLVVANASVFIWFRKSSEHDTSTNTSTHAQCE